MPIAGTIAADPDQPWQLYREAMKWCWLLSIVIITGYLFAIRGGRRAQGQAVAPAASGSSSSA